MQTVSDVQNVSPALERYMRAPLFGDLWNRPDLSPRDRSIITLAALIARSQTLELPAYLDLALGHGVTGSSRTAHLAKASDRQDRYEHQLRTQRHPHDDPTVCGGGTTGQPGSGRSDG